jgi:arsenate reductase
MRLMDLMESVEPIPGSTMTSCSADHARPWNVLFLCTGNTARSILAESILRKCGAGRFRAYSAGSRPKGIVNPFALMTLKHYGFPWMDFRSKSWDEFSGGNALQMDIVITVCDNAAGETCPLWRGQPLKAHWGIADPAAVEGLDNAKQHAFQIAFSKLKRRIDALVSLPIDAMDRDTASAALADIATMPDPGPFGEDR